MQFDLKSDHKTQQLINRVTDDDIGLSHRNYRHFANKTIKWAGSDTRELFEQNIKNPKTYEKLKLYGWLDTDCISYKYNKYGFRSDEFDDRPAGLALGCSHTEGIGIPEQNTWPSVLSKLLGIHIWNLGVGGVSLDTVFRLLDYWLPKLSPKFVTICIPNIARTELFQSSDLVNFGPWSTSSKKEEEFYYRKWIDSGINLIQLRRKNLLAIQQLCHSANVKLIMLDSYLILKTSDNDITPDNTARDLKHFGVQNHMYFAQQVYTALTTEIKK
jgi:hypothetical protein